MTAFDGADPAVPAAPAGNEHVMIGGGRRVYLVRPRSVAARHARLLKLHKRDPRRRPPPDIEDDLPTPLEPAGRRAPIAIDPVPAGSQFRSLWTLLQIVRFFGRRLHLKLTGRLDEERDAALTRRLFETLSGMWIKVGQLLSLRSDLMSPAMCRELANLQYQMRGFPSEVARRVIEEELQRPLSAAFAYFEKEPFAAASIAQVHRATLLRNNRAVVVKVMRPDVERAFQRDLRLLGYIVTVLKLFGLFKRFRLEDAMRELRAVLDEEVDYQREAVNLQRMRSSLRRHGVYVPRVVKKLSRRRVLVIEEVSGVLMSDYIRLRRDDPDLVHRWAVLNGITSKAVARRLAVTVLRQILEDNEFHGDLHPGNIMLLADNRIALIDLGSVGRLQRNVWTLYRNSLAALASRDYERAADFMLMMSPPLSPTYSRRVRRQMSAALHRWEFESQMPSATYADRSVAAMSRGIAKVMADNKVPLTWAIMRVGRTFSTLDASLQTLTPDADFMKLCRAYFRDRQRRRRTRQGQAEAWRSTLHSASAFASDFQVLLGSGIREQALRLHGMLDRGAYFRLTLLNYLSRGVWLLIILTAIGFFLDEDMRYAKHGTDMIPLGLIQFFVSAVPDLNFLHWVVLLIIGLYLSRMVRAARNSLANSE